MSGIIGAAEDFYRLRVARIDDTKSPDLDWRDDILWRDPPPTNIDEQDMWRVEAVRLDDEVALPVAAYESAEEAQAALEVLQEDLESLTKSQFDSRYLNIGGE